MKYIFYITNHGFGHASRNVPIINELLKRDPKGEVCIKSDEQRCNFLKRNFGFCKNIRFYTDCTEVGLVLKEGTLEPDIDRMKNEIEKDQAQWDEYVEREKVFLSKESPDIVIADVVCWAIKAAKQCNIPTMLIGNFSWAQMYKSFYGPDIWQPYLDYYRLADKAVWYEIHDKDLENYCNDFESVSMVSRTIDNQEVLQIKEKYDTKPIVFISLGASAEIEKTINVEEFPYNFLITRGLKLEGNNVYELPYDMINTPDYICAADYVIAKGGWSTVAEILLQRKKCALLFRGNNSEDDNTRKILANRGHCVCLFGDELENIAEVIKNIELLKPKSYDIYIDDTKKICDIIMQIIEKEKERKHDSI